VEPWTGAQLVFAVNVFYKNVDIFVITQREFQESWEFIAIVLFYRPMPSRPGFETSRLLVLHVKKKGGSVKTVRAPENIAVVRDAIERIHTVLRVATICHSGCLKPAFVGFYTTTFLL
jgi:hypothetical protein